MSHRCPTPGARPSSLLAPGDRTDGRFALGTASGRVQTFDDSGKLRTQARVSQVSLTGVDYAADGENIATSDVTGRVELLDASTSSVVGSPVQLPGPVAGVTLAPDGRTAFVVTRKDPIPPGATPTFDGWALLDLETGSVVRTGRLPEIGWLWDDFSPDGGRVAVSFDSGRVWIVDTRTGRPWTLLLRCTRPRSTGWVGPRTGHGSSATTAGARWSCGTPPPARFRTPSHCREATVAWDSSDRAPRT